MQLQTRLAFYQGFYPRIWRAVIYRHSNNQVQHHRWGATPAGTRPFRLRTKSVRLVLWWTA